MKIVIKSLHELKSDDKDNFSKIISITDSHRINLPFTPDILSHFEDTEFPGEDDWVIMNREVRKILSWSKNNLKDSDNILVHCHAGVSRSAAISWLILIQFGSDPKEAFQTLFKSRPQIWPNKVVMNIGERFLEINITKLVSDIDAEIALNKKEFLGYGG